MRVHYSDMVSADSAVACVSRYDPWVAQDRGGTAYGARYRLYTNMGQVLTGIAFGYGTRFPKKYSGLYSHAIGAGDAYSFLG